MENESKDETVRVGSMEELQQFQKRMDEISSISLISTNGDTGVTTITRKDGSTYTVEGDQSPLAQRAVIRQVDDDDMDK